ncbi:hypothetical protein Tco_0724941, partial [Tanacetum coccineum]
WGDDVDGVGEVAVRWEEGGDDDGVMERGYLGVGCDKWHEQANLARASLDKAAKKVKKWADAKRRHVEFEVGDQVMVKLLPQQFKSLRKVHKGLIRRYEGPFLMIGRVGKVSYRVQLPPKLKIHPFFHVSFLKPYHGDEEDPERGVSKRAPTAVVTSYDREVEEILSDRMIRRRGVPSFLRQCT